MATSHLKDPISTTTNFNEPCPLDTSYVHLLYLDSPSLSSELQDNSSVNNVEIELLPESKVQLDHTNLSPTDVFSEHHDYELFLVQKEFDAPNYNPNHYDIHTCENQDDILIHATNLSNTFALPQFMAQHNCEDQEPIDDPSAVLTASQASCDHTLKHKCAHNPMVAQCNQSQYLTLMKKHCVNSPTSSTLCFGEPTLKRLCSPSSSTLWDPIFAKLNQEIIPPCDLSVHTGSSFSVPSSSSETNQVSNSHSNLVTTPSSRMILGKPKIEVTKVLTHQVGKNEEYFHGENWHNTTKNEENSDCNSSLVTQNLMHHTGRNGEHSCVPFNLNNTSCKFMLKEVDSGGKHPINSVVDWRSHDTYPAGHNISEVDWGALHDSSFFLFLVNIDYDAKPKDFFAQELWGGLPEKTSSTTLRSLNHVEGKLVHHLELQKGPSRLDHQLDNQMDPTSSLYPDMCPNPSLSLTITLLLVGHCYYLLKMGRKLTSTSLMANQKYSFDIKEGLSNFISIKHYGNPYNLPDLGQHERKLQQLRSFTSYGFNLTTISVVC